MNSGDVTSTSVIAALNFKEEDVAFNDRLSSFLQQSDEQTLRQFLVYCTGSSLVPICFKIDVISGDGGSVYSSTCLNKLCIPRDVVEPWAYQLMLKVAI